MKVLFSASHFGAIRNFDSVVEALTCRGHQVVLLFDEPEELGSRELVESLCTRLPGVRWRWAPGYDDQAWFRVARKLRQGQDYLRFLEPAYVAFPKLALRLAERVPRALVWALRVPMVNSRGGRRVLQRALVALDRAMPRHAAMDAYLAEERPDVALFASVTNSRTPQLDHLRSARAIGIPSAVCVYSWDHLSSKALIRVFPDRTFVWNDTQKREAVQLHRLPAEHVVVTGAQNYDQWFERTPSRPPATFKAAIGLPADRPLLLYVCSALTPDPRESRFVRRWVEGIRGSRDERLRGAGILIRPHPERRAEWAEFDSTDLGPLVVAGRNPVTPGAKADYFDAVCASDAVVGLVTSAFLEAAIAGRPVLTITPPEMRIHQEGMLHFRYLLEVEDGLLDVAPTIDAHVAQLERILAGDRTWVERQTTFLRAFVRPRGLDVAATPIFVDAVEALAVVQTQPVADHAPALARALCRAVCRASTAVVGHALMMSATEADEERRRRESIRNHRRGKRRQRRTNRLAKVRRLLVSPEYRREVLARRLGGPRP